MKIKFGDDELPLYLKNNGFLSQWCCKCGSRHIWHFIILRGKTKEEDEIFLTSFRDEKAEELRRFYEREIKQKPTPKTKEKG